MPPSILYELYNLGLAEGTGIATYARNTVQSATKAGYAVDGLFHSETQLSRKDPVMAEVAFFDRRSQRTSPTFRGAENALRYLFGAIDGVTLHQLAKTGVVLDLANPKSLFSAYRNVYVARRFMDLSRFHFKRFGRSIRIRPPVRPDIFHATQPIPLRVPGALNIYTIHDLVPLRLPSATLDDKKFFLNMVRRLGATADHIVTVSEASRRDLIDIAGIPEEKITNTYQAVSIPPKLAAMADDEVANILRNAFNLDMRGYHLFFGAIEPKKNLGRIIDAYVGSGSPCPLVIAGGLGWDYQAELERLEAVKSPYYQMVEQKIVPREKIRRVGRVPQNHLVALIRGARALIFPSLYEGFGLPVLEAMTLGTPVITSNTSALAEVAGDAALTVNPFRADEIAEAIRTLDADEALRRDLSWRGREQAKKFSPERYVERLDALYAKLLRRAPLASPALASNSPASAPLDVETKEAADVA